MVVRVGSLDLVLDVLSSIIHDTVSTALTSSSQKCREASSHKRQALPLSTMAETRVLGLLVFSVLCALLLSAPFVTSSKGDRDIVEVEAYDGLVISNVERRILLNQHHVENVTHTLDVKNNGVLSAEFFHFALIPVKAGHLSIIEFKVAGTYTSLEQKPVRLTGMPPGSAAFQVKLPTVLASKSNVKLFVQATFTHTLIPRPTQIEQREPQLVQYTDNAYFFSPYVVEKQSTIVKLASANVKSVKPKKLCKLYNDEVRVTITSVSLPFSLKEMNIHSENNKPFITMKTMRKTIEVSHWGNVLVKESYLMEHTGAKLKGGFYRSEYQLRGTENQKADKPWNPSVRQIDAYLPRSANDIYYRDVIGNISTSHVRPEYKNMLVELQPRFPMFGGWKTDFTLGYNVPLRECLRVNKADTENYVLTMPFASPFPMVDVDELEVRVVLPEGAANIEWSTPFHIDSADMDVRMTYLDLTGRPVVVMRKNRVVKDHNQHFIVSYKFEKINFYREPVFIVMAFFAMFFTFFVFNRIDFSLTTPMKQKKH